LSIPDDKRGKILIENIKNNFFLQYRVTFLKENEVYEILKKKKKKKKKKNWFLVEGEGKERKKERYFIFILFY